MAGVWEFIRLQLAGNVLFWGTLGGSLLLHEVFGVREIVAVAIASAVFHVVFFMLDKHWVFSTKTGKQKTQSEVVRFVIFMGLNYFLNLGLIQLLLVGMSGTSLSGHMLTLFGASFELDLVIAQLFASAFFAFWSWLGLKYWVFRHVRHIHHAAHTIETKDTYAKRHARYKRLEAQQKAKGIA